MTFELIAERGPEPVDFDPLFASVDEDVIGSLDAVHDTANMPLNLESQQAFKDLNDVKARAYGIGQIVRG
jgi:hypothetical protein